jgi:hypothetical protein
MKSETVAIYSAGAHMPQLKSHLRFIGPRELPKYIASVGSALEDHEARFVLTVHSKPKVVVLGIDAYIALAEISGKYLDRTLAQTLRRFAETTRTVPERAASDEVIISHSMGAILATVVAQLGDFAKSVRFIGSRELHKNISSKVSALEDHEARFVVTIYSKPKVVMLGINAYIALAQSSGSPEDRRGAWLLGVTTEGLDTTSATQDESHRLIIHADIGEFVPEDETVEGLINLYRSLNAYHIALGGSGLVIDDWQILTREHVPAEVR